MKKHRILGKVKEYCEKSNIEFKLDMDGLDLRLVKIKKLSTSGYRGFNKSSGQELRLNTQNEIINYIRYYYK